MPTISEKGWLSDSEAEEETLIGRYGIRMCSLPRVALREYLIFFPLMYILWNNFFKKDVFKEDACKDIWEPWILSHYWHIQNEIDSFHSNLELIIGESGKNLRFETSLLSEWIETNLNPSYITFTHALYCLWKSRDQLFTILCVRIVKLLEEFIQ